MILRLAIGVVLSFCAGVSFAQLASMPEKIALRSIEKHRWQKAEAKLRKTLEKDSMNPGIRYVFSVFFFDPDNPDFDVDSAYHYAVTALDDYTRAPSRDRDRLRRISVDSLGMAGLRARIDSAAFEIAKRTNTEAAYLEFLSHFPSAMQRDLAEQLRDEVAYQEALKQNTYQAFLQYLKRYPDAQRYQDAKANYERLLYEVETQDRRLASFEKFFIDHPESPYRKEVYRNIYEISTADGTVESFLSFMTRYPVSDLAKKAGQMIFHLLADEDQPHWPDHFLSDSLKNVLTLNNTYLVPVFQGALYGFIDENGREVISPRFQTIHPDYLCGRVTDEVLMVNDGLIGRDGGLIYDGPILDFTDMGVGFLKVRSDKGLKVIHKSGFVFQDSVDDARILGKRYIAVKKGRSWGLYALSGRLLDEERWADIAALQNVIAFNDGKKIYIAPLDRLAKSAEGDPLQLSEPFDEVKPWARSLIWGRAGEFEGVLNQSLHPVIGFDRHSLTQTSFGAVARQSKNVRLYTSGGRRSPTFGQAMVTEPWVAVKKNKSWFLIDTHSGSLTSSGYDSVRSEGPFMVGISTDSVHVHFPANSTKTFYRPLNVSFVPGKDSTSFLLVEEHTHEKKLFNVRGQRLFSGSFDAIEYAGHGVFVVTKKDKKGLLDASGATLLQPEFDAIGTVRDNMVSLLRNKRFGAYNVLYNKLIRPQHDRNVLFYSENVISTFKDGHYGFIGWDSKPLSEFEFDEIRVWHDSLALVRKGALWNFYDIYAGRSVETNLRSISMIKNSDEEKLAIIQKENDYGVVSNRGKMVIPLTFSDVINLGTPDEPLYFTEKHIREAAIHIVIYYDRNGTMVRKEIYDSTADYDKIYCSDN